mgnify:CR=1 FL=1
MLNASWNYVDILSIMVLRENKVLQSGQANTNRLVKQMNVPLYLPEDDTALSCNKTLVQILNTKQSVSNK